VSISPSEHRAPGDLLGASCPPLQPQLVGHLYVTVKDDEDPDGDAIDPPPDVSSLGPGLRFVPLSPCMK
jgi:hypothetical protein